MQQFEIMSGVMRAFRNRIVQFLFVVIIGVIATIIYTLGQPQTYNATAVIQIESPQVAEPSLGGIGSTASHRLQLIEQRLMARDNLAQKIVDIGLYEDLPGLSTVEKVALLRQAITIRQLEGEAVLGFGISSVPSGLSVTVALDNPNDAATLANDLVEQVIDQNTQRRETEARETLSFFESEEARLLNIIEGLESELSIFRQENADILPGAVASLISQESVFEANMLDIDREILLLSGDNSRQRDSVVERQVAILEEQKTLLSERLAGVRAKIMQAPEAERELARLTRELALYQGQYDVVTANRSEAELNQTLESRKQSERFEILETAVPLDVPVSTSRRLIFAIGFAMSIVGAAALVFVIEQLNPAIRTASRLKSELDLTPVVTIPEIISAKEAFGTRLVIASMLAILFLVIPLVTLQFIGG